MSQIGIKEPAECVAATIGYDDEIEVMLFLQFVEVPLTVVV